MRIEIGSTEQSFSLNYHTYGIFTPASWLARLWESVWKYNVSIINTSTKLHPPRIGDFALMDKAVESHIFTNQELCSINRCRLYLNVFYLSDIVTGNGFFILHEALNGQSLTQHTSRWKWPRKSSPGTKDWRIWNIAIIDVWIQSETNRLRELLGDWIYPSHQVYKFVYSTEEDSIFEIFTNGAIHKY